MVSFEDFRLSPELTAVIKKLGFVKPTQIQELSIPHIITGEDVIGESATGSGKTLAFGCGIIEKVVPEKRLQALVLTPTRELAEQVKNELVKLSHQKHLKVMAIYGGVSINPQIHGLSRTNIVVSTPGRLLDHLNRKTINLSNIKILVLDEADRMLDMGFTDDVEKIIQKCPNNRQTMFFSATISSRVKHLVKHYMTKPVEVSAKKMVDPKKLTQAYYDIPKNMKMSLLIHLIQHKKNGLAMIFCNTRKTTDFVANNLKTNKINAIAIHGGLSQDRRTSTIKRFNNAENCVLVCTDVAARGLDINDVSYIYNYDMPKDANDYIHRIGRTARAGKEGKVINLLCKHDHDNFARIIRNYRTFEIKKIKKPEFKQIFATKIEHSNYLPRNRNIHRRGSYPKRHHNSHWQKQ